MKGQDRGLNNHRSLSLSWNERCFRKTALSILFCFSPLVMHRRGGSSWGLNGWTKETSLAVASWLERVVWPFVNISSVMLAEKDLFPLYILSKNWGVLFWHVRKISVSDTLKWHSHSMSRRNPRTKISWKFGSSLWISHCYQSLGLALVIFPAPLWTCNFPSSCLLSDGYCVCKKKTQYSERRRLSIVFSSALFSGPEIL